MPASQPVAGVVKGAAGKVVEGEATGVGCLIRCGLAAMLLGGVSPRGCEALPRCALVVRARALLPLWHCARGRA